MEIWFFWPFFLPFSRVPEAVGEFFPFSFLRFGGGGFFGWCGIQAGWRESSPLPCQGMMWTQPARKVGMGGHQETQQQKLTQSIQKRHQQFEHHFPVIFLGFLALVQFPPPTAISRTSLSDINKKLFYVSLYAEFIVLNI